MVETCSLQTNSSDSSSGLVFSLLSQHSFNKYLVGKKKKKPFQMSTTTLGLFRPNPAMYNLSDTENGSYEYSSAIWINGPTPFT